MSHTCLLVLGEGAADAADTADADEGAEGMEGAADADDADSQDSGHNYHNGVGPSGCNGAPCNHVLVARDREAATWYVGTRVDTGGRCIMEVFPLPDPAAVCLACPWVDRAFSEMDNATIRNVVYWCVAIPAPPAQAARSLNCSAVPCLLPRRSRLTLDPWSFVAQVLCSANIRFVRARGARQIGVAHRGCCARALAEPQRRGLCRL